MKRVVIWLKTADRQDVTLSELGRQAAWEALCSFTGETREELERSGVMLKKNSNGKPFFEGSYIGVSISHTSKTKKAVAVAAVCEGEVGVDVEDALRESWKVAKRMFSQQEQDWVREHEDGGFAQMWTLRESYAKWTGLGLAKMPAVEFWIEESGDIRCSDTECSAFSFCVPAEEWRISCIMDRQDRVEMEVFLEGKIFLKKYWKNA